MRLLQSTRRVRQRFKYVSAKLALKHAVLDHELAVKTDRTAPKRQIEMPQGVAAGDLVVARGTWSSGKLVIAVPSGSSGPTASNYVVDLGTPRTGDPCDF